MGVPDGRGANVMRSAGIHELNMAEVGVVERRHASIAPAVIHAAASGDVEALAEVMAAHDGDMTRICMVITGDVASARDAVQAAWPIAWRRMGTLRDPSRLRAWLMAVAANEARQLIRRERRRATHDGRAFALVQSPDPADAGDRLDLVAALARLAPDERRLIALRVAADLSSEEIARELGTTASAVRGRLARVLARLRGELTDG